MLLISACMLGSVAFSPGVTSLLPSMTHSMPFVLRPQLVWRSSWPGGRGQGGGFCREAVPVDSRNRILGSPAQNSISERRGSRTPPPPLSMILFHSTPHLRGGFSKEFRGTTGDPTPPPPPLLPLFLIIWPPLLIGLLFLQHFPKVAQDLFCQNVHRMQSF